MSQNYLLYGGNNNGIVSGRGDTNTVHQRNQLNRSADKIDSHITEIINECGSKLTKTTIEASHRNLGIGSSGQIAAVPQSQSVMLDKSTPHGRNANLQVNSGNFTREQLQKQQ